MIHVLKTWPAYFEPIWKKEKTFDLRRNDRDYKTGDKLVLCEYYSDEGYSGRRIFCTVGYTMYGLVFGLMDGWCIMSLKDARNINVDTVLVDIDEEFFEKLGIDKEESVEKLLEAFYTGELSGHVY